MSIPLEALRAILSRGRISATDQMAIRFWQGVGGPNDRRGLRSLAHEYQTLRVAKSTPTVKKTAKLLEKLIKLAEKGTDILDRDLTGTCTLNVGLRAFGADTAMIAGALRLLHDAAAQAREMIHVEHDTAAQAKAMNCRTDVTQRQRTEGPEVWLSMELYRAYCELSGKNEIGDDGPLYEFVNASIAFLNTFSKIEIVMPNPVTFRQRIRDALDRRTPE